MTSTSLDILEDSLNQKLEIMNKIQEENSKQKVILSESDNVDSEAFDKTLDNKGEYIDKLNSIEDGFQILFDKVKADVGDHKDLYNDQIKRIQKMIRAIDVARVSIEEDEHNIKNLAEKYFSEERSKMSTGKKNAAAAFNYYQTMSKSKDIPPQFMDQKN